MAAFGLPGGAELWVCLLPLVVVGVVVALAFRGHSQPPAAGFQAPQGWYADPTGRHEFRYWSGTAWTTTVSDAGVQSQDSV
jgi:hypothetical protein